MIKLLANGVDYVTFDDEFLFDSLRDVRLSLGMPYYDQDYQLQYDTGIYNRPAGNATASAAPANTIAAASEQITSFL